MEKIININKEKLVTMKYECQDNDALIELSDDKMDLFISIDGETSQTIISLDDLRKSLIQFGIEYLSDTLKHYANERVIDELERIKKECSKVGSRYITWCVLKEGIDKRIKQLKQ